MRYLDYIDVVGVGGDASSLEGGVVVLLILLKNKCQCNVKKRGKKTYKKGRTYNLQALKESPFACLQEMCVDLVHTR
jgi:hypothetical protein